MIQSALLVHAALAADHGNSTCHGTDNGTCTLNTGGASLLQMRSHAASRVLVDEDDDEYAKETDSNDRATERCTAPEADTIPNSVKGETCAEGAKVDSGAFCTTQCAAGFTPSVAKLDCDGIKFKPAKFHCVTSPTAAGAAPVYAANARCTAPEASVVLHSNKAGTCLEGKKITAGSSCTPQCMAGYKPTVASLACDGATFSPATFECEANGCAAPTGVANVAAAGACAEGATFASGSTCTGQCAAGYKPFVSGSLNPILTCNTGVLQPATFTCEQQCTIPPPGKKRGIGIGWGRSQALDWAKYDHSIVQWWFDWQYNDSGVGSLKFTPETLASSNFVPMVHGSTDLGDNMAKVFEGSPYLMGFNEPYGPVVNMSPQEVTDAWPQLEEKAKQIAKKLGITYEDMTILTPSFNPKDMTYCESYKELMDAAGNRFDAILVDYYACTALELKQGLDAMYALFQKPIWLKEFNCGDGGANAPAASHLAYMKEALPMLEEHPHVARYSWMASTAPTDCSSASLIDGVTNKLTDLGHFYNTATTLADLEAAYKATPP